MTRAGPVDRMGAVISILATALVVAAQTTLAQDSACRQALALGLDVSGSVDSREYRLQREGLIYALGTRRVRAALLAQPNAPIEIMVFEWSGVEFQREVVPWMAIRGETDITILRDTLEQTRRSGESPGTALGTALETGRAYLRARQDCWKLTLDISGDGKSNLGPEPDAISQDMATRDKITVNALVIGADSPSISDLRQAEIGELARYFETNVIAGSGSFVQTALGYEEYGSAMARKLERELEGLVFSNLFQPLSLDFQ